MIKALQAPAHISESQIQQLEMISFLQAIVYLFVIHIKLLDMIQAPAYTFAAQIQQLEIICNKCSKSITIIGYI